MADSARVVTAKLPGELALPLDDISKRIGRSKSWIVCQALSEWLAEEQRRHELTLEALTSMDDGRSFSQEEINQYFAAKQQARQEA